MGNAANEDADFALVAVAPFAERSRMPVTTFGYLRLDDQPGKVAENEFITIIQHPGGRHKQIALRENEVLAKGSNDKRPVLLYRSDTAPGSSGSPCFNDQWQVGCQTQYCLFLLQWLTVSGLSPETCSILSKEFDDAENTVLCGKSNSIQHV